jgi:hypothetical protein
MDTRRDRRAALQLRSHWHGEISNADIQTHVYQQHLGMEKRWTFFYFFSLFFLSFCLFFISLFLSFFLSSPSIIRIMKARRMRWARRVARMGEKRNAYRLLVGKPEGRRPLGRPRRTWVDFVEVGWGDVDWIGLPQDRDRWRALVNYVLNLRVP